VYWFKKHNLPYKQSIGIDGKMTKETDFMCGACGVHVTDWKVSERQSE
jgi:hypothetical protein